MNRCPQCGKENSESAKKCIYCGTALFTADDEDLQKTRDISKEEIEKMLKEAGIEDMSADGIAPAETKQEVPGERTVRFRRVRAEEPKKKAASQENEAISQQKEEESGAEETKNKEERARSQEPEPIIIVDDDESDEEAYRPRKKKKKSNTKMVVLAVVLVLAIIACGIFAFVGLKNYSKIKAEEEAQKLTTAKLSQAMKEQLSHKDDPDPTPEATPTVTEEAEKSEETAETPSPESNPEAQPTQEAVPVEEPEITPEPIPDVTAQMTLGAAGATDGCFRADVREATASSVIQQEGVDNSPYMAIDGLEETSWQEGTEGHGEGESINFALSGQYNVHCLTFKLGNWANDEAFQSNSRPSALSIWLNGNGFTVGFPDSKTEFCIVFSQDIPCTNVYVQIDGVYGGAAYADTCISEIGIYCAS